MNLAPRSRSENCGLLFSDQVLAGTRVCLRPVAALFLARLVHSLGLIRNRATGIPGPGAFSDTRFPGGSSRSNSTLRTLEQGGPEDGIQFRDVLVGDQRLEGKEFFGRRVPVDGIGFLGWSPGLRCPGFVCIQWPPVRCGAFHGASARGTGLVADAGRQILLG